MSRGGVFGRFKSENVEEPKVNMLVQRTVVETFWHIQEVLGLVSREDRWPQNKVLKEDNSTERKAEGRGKKMGAGEEITQKPKIRH